MKYSMQNNTRIHDYRFYNDYTFLISMRERRMQSDTMFISYNYSYQPEEEWKLIVVGKLTSFM